MEKEFDVVKGMSKNEAWDYAVGLVKVDDLEPTPLDFAVKIKSKRPPSL
jgi:hypothetical protein